MTDQSADAPFRTWAIVEIMGHVSLAGEVSEQTIAGAAFVRVDVPALDGQGAFTRLYGAGSIYSITPVSEEIARRAAASMRARPVTVYLQPALPGPIPSHEDDGPDPDDTDPDDDEAEDDDDDLDGDEDDPHDFEHEGPGF